ncbi:MAG TPA: MBL fold metallo-hydrolase [Anaerolineae bacterium]|nr:MBL fold metallo-hydrolase [Anaerolineae bacterium]
MSDPAADAVPHSEPGLGIFTGRGHGLLLVALMVLAAIVWLAVLQLPDGRLHVVFLDVGQGDAILITAPDGKQILVDGGPSPNQLFWALGRQLPFWDRSLDMVVLTHADTDHMRGLVPLFDRYHVQQVLAGAQSVDAEEAHHWWDAVEQAGAVTTVAERGMRIVLGEAAEIEVLHPGAAPLLGGSDNDSSVVLRLDYAATSFLLTGDLESRGEQDLLQSGQVVAAQTLKVSHHGSAGATTVQFLETVAPTLAVIQVGRDNHFGHPAPELLERLAYSGARLLRTDLHGTIHIISDGQKQWVRTVKRAPQRDQ